MYSRTNHVANIQDLISKGLKNLKSGTSFVCFGDSVKQGSDFLKKFRALLVSILKGTLIQILKSFNIFFFI